MALFLKHHFFHFILENQTEWIRANLDIDNELFL